MTRFSSLRTPNSKFRKLVALTIASTFLPAIHLGSLRNLSHAGPKIGFSSAWADPGSIPDEIDFQKHLHAYEVAKQLSDMKRGRASDLEAAAVRSDNALKDRSALLAQKTERLSRIQEEIATAERDARNLEIRVDILKQEIASHEGASRGNQQVLNQLAVQQATLTTEISRKSEEVSKLKRQEIQAARELETQTKTLNQLRQQLESRNSELNSAEAELASKTQRAKDIGSDITATEAAIARADANLRDAREQARPLPALITQLETEARALEPQRSAAQQRAQADEAALTSAKAALQMAQNRLHEVENRLHQLDREIRSTTADLSAAEAQAQVNRRTVTETETQITNAQTELSRLKDLVPTQEKDLADAIAAVDVQQAASQAIADQITTRDQKVKDLIRQGKNPSTDPEILRLKSEIKDLNSQKEPIDAKLSTLKAQRDMFKATLTGTRQKITDQTQLLVSLREKLAHLNHEHRTLLTKIDQLKAALPGLETRKREASADVSAAQAVETQTRTRVTSAQTAADHSKEAFAKLDVLLRANQAKLAQTRSSLQTLESQIRSLEASSKSSRDKLARLATERGQLNTDILAIQNRLPGIRQAIATLRPQVDTAQAKVQALQITYDNIHAQYENGNGQLAILRNQANQLQTKIDGLLADNHRLAELIATKRLQIQGDTATARSYRDRAQAMRVEAFELPGIIARLEAEVRNLRNSTDRAWAEYRVADQEAQTAERDTTVRYNRYIETKRNYDQQLLAAHEAGVQQGALLGKTQGAERGGIDGKQAGTDEGQINGKREGLEAGFKAGSEAGYAKGYETGFAHGAATPGEYEKARAAGEKQGDEDAIASARDVDYPKARAARHLELTSTLPTQVVRIDNTPPAGNPTPSLARKASSKRSLVKDSAQSPSMMELRGGAIRSLLRSNWAPPADPSQANCARGFPDFDQACVQGYSEGFAQSYDEAYAASFKPAKEAAYSEAYRVAFEQNNRVRWQEGYDASYPQGYAKGDTAGADSTRNRGYADGKDAGYQRSIGPAREAAIAKANADETQYFQDHAVVKLLDATASNQVEVQPGEALSLTAHLANFGGKPTAGGAYRMRWELISGQAQIDPTLVSLIEAPAGSQAYIQSILKGQVSADASGEEPIELKVTLVQPDGGTQETRIQLRVAPQVKLGVTQFSTTHRPLIGSDERVTVKITNTGKFDATDDLRVVLSTNAPANGVRLVRETAKLNPLRKGSSANADLSYRVLSESLRNKDLTLTVKIYQGKAIVGSGQVSVKPRLYWWE